MSFKPRSLSRLYKRIAVIPDTQIRVGVPTDHLIAAGKYIAEHQFDIIVVLGDWFDNVATSRHHTRKTREGVRILDDLQSGIRAMDVFTSQWRGIPGYNPRMVFCVGNHEERLAKYVHENPELEGILGPELFNLDVYGFEVYPFLQPVIIEDIAFCHYFPQNPSGAIMQQKRGAPSARAQVQRVGMSCVAGHKQGLDYHVQQSLSGRRHGLIAGSFYMHHETYKTPMGNDHWRGMVVLNRVRNGDFDVCPVSIDYLMENYGTQS